MLHFLFITDYAEHWGALAPLYAALASKSQVKLSVLACPMRSHERGLTGYSSPMQELLQQQAIPYIDISQLDWNALTPDGIIMSYAIETERPNGFAADILRRRARLIYVPHHYPLRDHADHDWYYDQPLCYHAWRIFVADSAQQARFARFCSRGSRGVRAVGSLSQQALLQAKARDFSDIFGRPPPSANSQVFLYAPHYSLRWWGNPQSSTRRLTEKGWSSFVDGWLGWRDIARANPQHAFVLRMHPMLLPFAWQYDLIKPEDWQKIQTILLAEANIYLHFEPEYQSLLLLVDAMVSDLSSICYEFAALGRPIYAVAPAEDVPRFNAAIAPRLVAQDAVTAMQQMVTQHQQPKSAIAQSHNPAQNIADYLLDTLSS